MQIEIQKNADRFTGFAEIYDQARPSVPAYPIGVIERYLGGRPETVVDLGTGTGLSALVWKGKCARLIGIEPSEDMLAQARMKEDDTLTFRRGTGNDTGLADSCADVVVCSQSFHWMEPLSTLQEINRILREGGVFAAIDCDWPPVAGWEAERAYMQLYDRVRQLEAELPDVRNSFVRYEKEHHLENIRKSGWFRYCREVLFTNTEPCTAQRLVKLLLSQGSLQTIQKQHPGLLEEELEKFRQKVFGLYGNTEFSVDFCYRMRIAVK